MLQKGSNQKMLYFLTSPN